MFHEKVCLRISRCYPAVTVVFFTAGNWSAFDFAIEMQAPDALFRELLRCGADKYARLVSSIPSISDMIAVEVDSVDEEIVSVQF